MAWSEEAKYRVRRKHGRQRNQRRRHGGRASQIGVWIDEYMMQKISEVPVEEARDLSHRVLSSAKARAPRDTGKLASSIDRVETPKGAVVFVDTGGGLYYGKRETGYGTHVELGTQFINAQPYMRPAWVASARALIPAVRRHLEKLGR